MGYDWYDGGTRSVATFGAAFIRRQTAFARLYEDGIQNLFFPNDHVVLFVAFPMMVCGLAGTCFCLGKGLNGKFLLQRVTLCYDLQFRYDKANLLAWPSAVSDRDTDRSRRVHAL